MNKNNNIKTLRDTLGFSQADDEMEDRKFKRKKNFCSLEEIRAKTIAENLIAISRSFRVGSCYQISEKKSQFDSMPFHLPILRYERKNGIHHVFREVIGKWIVTYTDAQLIGKNIQEVDENYYT